MGNGGKYPERPKVEFLGDGRLIRLLEDFVYIDPKGTRWKSPKDALADGASIPRPLWPLIGGPFEGRYRDASIVHDFYCSKRHKPWKQVHRMFYDAMITSGVGKKKAQLMYAGVYLGGPRWTKMDEYNASLVVEVGSHIVSERLRSKDGFKSVIGRGGRVAGEMRGKRAMREVSKRGSGILINSEFRVKNAKVRVAYRYALNDEDLERLEKTVNRRGADLKSIEQEVDQMVVGRKKKSGKPANYSEVWSTVQKKHKSAARSLKKPTLK